MSGTGRPARMLVYVAAPYAAANYEGVQENVRRAMFVARIVAAAHREGFGIKADLTHGRTGTGYAPMVPHALGWCGLFGDPFDSGAPSPARSTALQLGMDLLERCEVLVILEGASAGVKGEYERAAERRLDVYSANWERWLELGDKQDASHRRWLTGQHHIGST